MWQKYIAENTQQKLQNYDWKKTDYLEMYNIKDYKKPSKAVHLLWDVGTPPEPTSNQGCFSHFFYFLRMNLKHN